MSNYRLFIDFSLSCHRLRRLLWSQNGHVLFLDAMQARFGSNNMTLTIGNQALAMCRMRVQPRTALRLNYSESFGVAFPNSKRRYTTIQTPQNRALYIPKPR